MPKSPDLPFVVQTSRSPVVLIALLGLLFLPMSLGVLLSGFRSGPVLVSLLVCVYGVLVWLVRRGQVNSVRSFTAEGLVRGDGRTLRWADLRSVVNQVVLVRAHRKRLWRTEIQFTGGEAAWLIPSKIRNYDEVAAFVRTLPCEHREELARG